MKVNVLREVKVDGVPIRPGVRNIEDGYARSLIAAGWAEEASAKDELDPDDSELIGNRSDDDDEPNLTTTQAAKAPAKKKKAPSAG